MITNNSKIGYPRKAFTLLELLVVISIIAILVSIVLPAFNLARKQARLTVCTLNLKNISHGLMMYAGDNRDKYPNRETVGGWKFRAAPGYKDPSDERSLPETLGLAAVLDGREIDMISSQFSSGKYKYIDGQSAIWICPDQPLEWMQDMGNTYSYRTDDIIKLNSASDLMKPVLKGCKTGSGVRSTSLISANEWLLRDNTAQLPYVSGFAVPEGVYPSGFSFVPDPGKYPHFFGGSYKQVSNTLFLDFHVRRDIYTTDGQRLFK